MSHPNEARPTSRPIREMSEQDKRRLRDDAWNHPSLAVTGAAGPRVMVVDDHRSLDGEARPPAEWEKQNADARRELWKAEAEQQARDRKRARDALPAYERLARVLRDIGALQSPRAAQMQHTTARSGADKTQVLPSGGRHGDVAHAAPHEVDSRLRQITLHIEALEELLDEHRGLAHTSYVLMGKDQKDRLLTGPRFRGLRPEEISALHPELGAPRTIRYIRSLAGQNLLGFDRPPRDANAG